MLYLNIRFQCEIAIYVLNVQSQCFISMCRLNIQYQCAISMCNISVQSQCFIWMCVLNVQSLFFYLNVLPKCAMFYLNVRPECAISMFQFPSQVIWSWSYNYLFEVWQLTKFNVFLPGYICCITRAGSTLHRIFP